MRQLSCLTVVVSACVGMAATPEVAPRVPLAIHKMPCALVAKSKAAPSCFKPLDVKNSALVRAERTTCRFATTAHFVGVQPALSMLIHVVEGQVSFALPFLLEGDGTTHVIPETVTEASWSSGSIVGLASNGKQVGFWKGDTCEVMSEGNLSGLAPLSDGRFLALWTLEDRTVQTVERATDGTWSSWGPTLQVYTERLVARSGRVALIFDATTSSPQRDFGTEHPDVGRTRVLGRLTEQPQYTEYIPSGGWVPLEPEKGATFSRAIAVADGSLGGDPALYLPRGDETVRVPLPELAKRSEASASGALSWDAGVLIARLESRSESASRRIEPPPRNCPPGAPCAPPQQPYTQVWRIEKELTLALYNAGKRTSRILELPLPPRNETDQGRIAGLTVAATASEIFVSAEGFFFVFDRAELERRAR